MVCGWTDRKLPAARLGGLGVGRGVTRPEVREVPPSRDVREVEAVPARHSSDATRKLATTIS